MNRQYVSLTEIADYNNLVLALHKASKGKRHRSVVRELYEQFDKKISGLAQDIVAGQLPYGFFKSFQIYDPKKRLIYAACFADRVFHHAVMNIAGERLEKSMINHSYACRPGKGVHKAIIQVQGNLQRYKWFVKIDIAAYFSRIDHNILLALLRRRFKGKSFHDQLHRIVKSCPDMQDKGLPIGSLTSQYFANYYLDGLDRFLAAHPHVNGAVRYMDDVIWWCNNKKSAKKILLEVREYLKVEWLLTIKPNIQILPSHAGVTYCGFRITPGIVRLSRRRKRAIRKRRQYWEQEYLQGNINAVQLQTAYAAVHAIAQGSDSFAWRQHQLKTSVLIDV